MSCQILQIPGTTVQYIVFGLEKVNEMLEASHMKQDEHRVQESFVEDTNACDTLPCNQEKREQADDQFKLF